jgi:hypothetical protein
MSSRSGTSLSGNAGQGRTTMKRRGGLPSMSEKQTQAYLIARDALRWIQRTSALVPPPGKGEPILADRVEGTHPRIKATRRLSGSAAQHRGLASE